MALPSRRSSAVQPSTGRVPPSSVTPDPGSRTSSPRLLAGAGVVLLILWLMAMMFRLGGLSHVLLLTGLMLLMMAALKARDAAASAPRPSESEER